MAPEKLLIDRVESCPYNRIRDLVGEMAGLSPFFRFIGWYGIKGKLELFYERMR